MSLLKAISRFAGKTFACWVLLFAVLGFFFPDGFTWIGSYISILLGIIMFGMGMTLTIDDFKELFLHPKAVFIGVIAHYIIMPSIAFTLSIIFRLPPEIAIGVILVGACPSGTASNVIAYLAKGNTALSVACTSISTLLSPILTPVVILLFASKWLPVSVGDLIWSVAKMVILPIFLGLIVKIFFKKQVEKSVEVLPLVSVIGIVAIVAAVVSSSRESILDTGMLVFGVVILHNLFGYLLGFLLSKWLKLSYSDQKAIAIEVGMQNSGLGAALAAAHFNPVAAVPSAIFSFWHNISGPLLATYWGNKAAKRQKTVNPSERSTKSTII